MNMVNRILLTLILAFCTLSAIGKDRLEPGETLSNDQSISSPSGNYTLIMQADGSLVMYRSDGTIRYRFAKYGTHAIMQTDGNFVEYAGSTPIWDSQTGGRAAGAQLTIHDNGELDITKTGTMMTFGYWNIGPDIVSGQSQIVTHVPPGGPAPNGVPNYVNFPNIDNNVNKNLRPRYEQ